MMKGKANLASITHPLDLMTNK